jgi:hypothetical protein
MSELVQVVAYLNLVAFVALAVVAVRQWQGRRDVAAAWVALCFGALALVVLLGQVTPEHPGSFGSNLLVRFEIALLVVFPYLLFRFTMAFRRPDRKLYAFVSAMTVILVIWTFALPHIPERGEPRSTAFGVYLVLFLVHWAVLSVASAWRLWRAGRRQPTVSRRRMQLLAIAAAALTLAIILVASTSDPDSPLAAASGLLGTVSALAFMIGLAPPAVLRTVWRRPEGLRVQKAIESLMRLATSQEEVAARVLEPMAAIVGARGIELRNEQGQVVGTYGDVGGEDGEVVELDGASICVWTTPYAPFFSSEELALLRTLASLTALALDRVRLFEQEHKARLDLERANQVKTNFVALAAHELRTPVTTIHGFVQTLHHLGDRLDDAQRDELREALEQQTARMALLVGQRLDQ